MLLLYSNSANILFPFWLGKVYDGFILIGTYWSALLLFSWIPPPFLSSM